MMTALIVLVIFVLAYLLGSIPCGLLVARSHGIDIREHGSKNIGATNVWRVLGKRPGLIAFFGDTFKGWLAVTLGMWIAAHCPISVALPHGHTRIDHFDAGFAGITAALGCILGHNFPVWLRFKGGKGVATSLGVIFGMMPLASLTIFAIWGIVLKLTRYVSLASLIAAISLPVVVIGLMFFWPRNWWGAVHGWANFYFAVAATLLVVKRHTSNIKRLLDGTENRFGTPKAPSEEAPPAV
jgi:glycerol-3-phosphate acyltransferase PlsY